jgi:hypothetical protein
VIRLAAATLAAGLTALVLAAFPAQAAPGPRIVTTFSYAAGQTPEALASAPGGGVYVSLSEAGQVDQVSPAGRVSVAGRVPLSGPCPVFGVPISTGLVTVPGGIDVLACDGDGDTGVWYLRAGRAVQITRLPASAVPNGLTEAGGWLYAADSALGVIWRSPAAGGPAQVWASGPALTPVSYIGLNGIYAEGGAVWADNTDRGTVLRIPVRPGGAAGPAAVVYSGLAAAGLDDFTVAPGGTVIMAEELAGRVAGLRPGRPPEVLLTTADGLSDPVDAWRAPGGLWVADSGYITQAPNLLLDPRWEGAR